MYIFLLRKLDCSWLCVPYKTEKNQMKQNHQLLTNLMLLFFFPQKIVEVFIVAAIQVLQIPSWNRKAFFSQSELKHIKTLLKTVSCILTCIIQLSLIMDLLDLFPGVLQIDISIYDTMMVVLLWSIQYMSLCSDQAILVRSCEV